MTTDGSETRPGTTNLGPSPAGPRRPLVERVGLALIAALLVAMFGAVAVAAWLGGEPFLAAMGAIGCLMTGWAGAFTLLRG